MPRVWFHVLCHDEGDKAACERTKALMRDCKVRDIGPMAAHHHGGKRRLGSVNGALRRMGGLNELACRGVIKISARTGHHG